MFKCDNERCGGNIKHGDKPVKVVIETRPKVYPEVLGPPQGWMRDPKVIDAGGEGFETVKELTLCAPCAKARAERESPA